MPDKLRRATAEQRSIDWYSGPGEPEHVKAWIKGSFPSMNVIQTSSIKWLWPGLWKCSNRCCCIQLSRINNFLGVFLQLSHLLRNICCFSNILFETFLTSQNVNWALIINLIDFVCLLCSWRSKGFNFVDIFAYFAVFLVELKRSNWFLNRADFSPYKIIT